MIEENFIYFPDKEVGIYPENYNLIYDDVYFKTEDDLTLHGWFIYGKNTNKTILWFKISKSARSQNSTDRFSSL